MTHSIQLVAVLSFATTCFAQTTITEVEPNDSKAQASANGAISLFAGDSISGTTTGASTTVPGDGSVDCFWIQTGPLSVGLYRHTLTLTTVGTSGHVGSLRGLDQADGGPIVGGIIGVADVAFAVSSETTTPARSVSWYGYGFEEKLYFRVEGTSATTAPYVATLSTVPVTPIVVSGTFEAGLLTFSTIQQTPLDTEIQLIDTTGPWAADDASNDDESVAEGGTGTTAQSQLRRTLSSGLYWIGLGRSNVASNENSPGTDDLRTGVVLDFPDILACSNPASGGGFDDLDLVITDVNGSVPVAVLGGGLPYEVVFVEIRVVDPPGPPISTYCVGDGTATACPCFNGAPGNGCPNSINPAGANLAGTGTPSVTGDTLALLGTGMPNSSALYAQGSGQVIFPVGDGTLCVGGNIVRLGTKLNASGASRYPAGGDLPVSIRGGVAAGQTLHYQVWYRNSAPSFCLPEGHNLTNALNVTWSP